jgi:hypothetical protein
MLIMNNKTHSKWYEFKENMKWWWIATVHDIKDWKRERRKKREINKQARVIKRIKKRIGGVKITSTLIFGKIRSFIYSLIEMIMGLIIDFLPVLAIIFIGYIVTELYEYFTNPSFNLSLSSEELSELFTWGVWTAGIAFVFGFASAISASSGDQIDTSHEWRLQGTNNRMRGATNKEVHEHSYGEGSWNEYIQSTKKGTLVFGLVLGVVVSALFVYIEGKSSVEKEIFKCIIILGSSIIIPISSYGITRWVKNIIS